MSQQIREQLQATLGSAYTLERELGGGGMSRVFVAEETALRRKVVVKVLPPELTAGVNVERFNREILLAAKLQHPHIVPVLSAGETNGLPYYTMPLVEGQSLRARLAAGGQLGITEIVGLLRDVARALAYAHERGIVHRDIKPDNVLITGGSATVTDFGIAKAISASRTQGSAETLTQIGTSIGTPTYMSPEQAAGDPDTDHRADIYSFGCMAYELLTSQPPFVEKTPRRLLAAHMGDKPRAVTELRTDIPNALADLVMRCLAKEADDRPQQATDLVRVLETVSSSGSGQALPSVMMGGPGMFRKALAIYGAAFVAVAVLTKAAIVGIGLPDWVFPGSLIVMALGLPVILWTGYVHRVTRRAMTMTPTYTPGGTAAVAHGTIATMALKAAPHVSWYRTARGGVYAFGAFIVVIAAFMVMRGLGIGPFGSLLATGRIQAQDPIIMTDFSVTSGDTALARVVSFAVRTALSQSRVLEIMNPAAVAGALERMERPRTSRVDLPLAQGIALREGIKAIVDGEVVTVGSGYVLTVRLVTTDSARVLASVQASGDGPQGLIEAADKVARDLRAKAGESLRSVQNTVPLVRARTASLDALRRYSEATIANDVDSDFPKAMRLLREAVAIDTGFAEAWRKLATAMNNLALPRASVDSMFTKAFQLRASLPDGDRAVIEASYYGSGPGQDRAKAIAAYERAVELAGFRRNNLANLLGDRREYAKAESLYRADVARDSGFLISHRNLTSSLIAQGKLTAADSVIGLMRRRFPRAPDAGIMSLGMTYLRGQYEAVQRQLDSARGVAKGANLSDVLQMAATVALVRGQMGKWRTLRGQRIATDSMIGRRPIPASEAATELSVAMAVRGEAAGELRKFDDALARSPLRALSEAERPDVIVAISLARAGQPSRARAVLSGFEASVRDTALRRVAEPDIRTARGWIALAEGRPDEAIAELRRGDVAPDGPAHGFQFMLPMALAKAFDAANQPDSAIVQLETFLASPNAWRAVTEWVDGAALAGSHERLAQLYEAKGLNDKAAEHYRIFIEMWKSADPELQPRVRAAQERLRRVAPVERTKP